MYRRVLAGFIPLFLLLTTAMAQVPGRNDDTSVYRIYGEQIAELLRVRGLDPDEILEIQKIYKDNNISSDDNVAALLSKLYPSDRGVAMLFYYFRNDTLRRVLFEPGIVREKKYIRVKREDLLQLSNDLNHVLGLYSASNNRTPVKRGVIIKPPPATKGLTYDNLIARTTQLLLPDSFSQSYRHLIIIPALNIGTIPFHLLKPNGGKAMLIDQCSFSIAPTVVDLLGLRVRALKYAARWTGNLNIKYDDAPELRRLDSVAFTLESPLFVSNPAYPTQTEYSFPDLPGAKKEIQLAIPFAKKYVLLEGVNATKENVMKYIGDADVAYFATHGMADSANPKEKSFLVLSGNDPFLTVQNIMESRKNYKKFPEMVILSACQTGLGRSMEAGVAGLARSFMLAGSFHVIMSLWNVDDEATAYFMSRFIYHLKMRSRFMPAEPLRKAALDTRKIYPKPSQWASFSLFGIDY